VLLERALGGAATVLLGAIGFLLAIGRYDVNAYLWIEGVFVFGTIVLLFLFGGAFFLFLGRIGLIEPDEGRYSEIPREMLEKGDFLTPTLNYVHYFEKPPLHYWLNALSFKLFGLNEFAARFSSALAGLLTLLLVYHTARTLFGRREAILSAFILGTSTGFLVQSRINLTDMTLTFFLSAALCSFILAVEETGKRTLYCYLFFLFSACAVLTKGLIGLLFPGAIPIFYLLATGRWHLLKEMGLAGGMVLFLALTAPWFVLVSLANPEFARFFFIHEHFERYLSRVHGRYQPFWYFVPILLLTMFPWSIYVMRAIRQAIAGRQRQQGASLLYLLLWAATIFLFFSLSSSKLIPYILPVFPPLAILMGKMFSDQMDKKSESRFFPENILLCSILFCASVLIALYPHVRELAPLLVKSGLVRPASSLLTKPPLVTPLGGGLVAGLSLAMGLLLCFAQRRKDIHLLFAGLCLYAFMLETAGAHFFMDGIAFKKTTREFALQAGQILSDKGVLVSFGYEQSLPFYTGRRTIVVGSKGELEFGSQQGDQSNWFIDEAAFIRLWQENRPVVVLMKKEEYRRISDRLIPRGVILGEKYKKILVTNSTGR